MLTRRSLLSAAVGARGREAQQQTQQRRQRGQPRANSAFRRPKPGDIVISGNENPLGPGPGALDALIGTLDETGRYPINSAITATDLTAKIAASIDAHPENIVLGAGPTSRRWKQVKQRVVIDASENVGRGGHEFPALLPGVGRE